MRLDRRAALAGGAWLSIAGHAGCASAQASPWQAILDTAVSAGAPGLQAFVRHGAREWIGAAGVASVETGAAMRTDLRLRAASITKMMTYAVTMEFVKARRLGLDDRVETHLPSGALHGIAYTDEITIAHLLNHASGLYNFNGAREAPFFAALFGDPERGRHIWSAGELVAFARAPGAAATGRPGEATSYCSTGYIVLEMALEHVARKPLLEIYREHLFAPLRMASAGMEGADLFAQDIVGSYAIPAEADLTGPSPFTGRAAVRPDGLVNLSAGLETYNAWARGAGAVALSVRDLAHFMHAVRDNERIVIHDQAREFERVGANPRGALSWNGGSWGIQATIRYAPAHDATVIVISNASNAGPGSHDIATQLLDRIRGAQ